jgi:hypothetical protein
VSVDWIRYFFVLHLTYTTNCSDLEQCDRLAKRALMSERSSIVGMADPESGVCHISMLSTVVRIALL